MVGLSGTIVAIVSTGFAGLDSRQDPPSWRKLDPPSASAEPVRLPVSRVVSPAPQTFAVLQPSVDAQAVPASAAELPARPAASGTDDPFPSPVAQLRGSAAAAVATLAANLAAQPDESDPRSAPGELWPDAAVKCPRDWLAVHQPGATDASADCAEPLALASLDGAQPGDGSGAGAESGVLPDSPESVGEPNGATAFVELPRVPLPRPDPPERPKARVQMARAGGLGAPPDCGKKRAKWHFVNKARTQRQWYCR